MSVLFNYIEDNMKDHHCKFIELVHWIKTNPDTHNSMHGNLKIETKIQFKWIELVSSSTLILGISTNVSQALVSEHM